jgi:hypothetical protein
MNKTNLDERQLWLRGEVLKHCLFLIGGLLLLKMFLKAFELSLVDEEWVDIFIIAITMTLGCIEKSLRGVFNFDDIRMTAVIVILGIAGAISFVLNIIHFTGGEGLVSGGQLTQAGVFWVMSLSFIAITAVYFFTRARYLKRLSD